MSDLCKLPAKYLIRQGRIEDCLAIAHMVNESANGAVDYLYQGLYRSKSPVDVLSEQMQTEVHYSYANTMVVESDGQIVAMALSFPSSGLICEDSALEKFSAAKRQYFKYFSDNRIDDSWHLDAIYVDAAFRHHGVGKLLLTEVKRQAVAYGFHAIQVFVFTSNEGAIRFYNRDNFVLYKQIPLTSHEFLKQHECLMLMKCDLVQNES